MYIADVSNNRIRKVTVSTGIISTIAGTGTTSYSGDNGAATSAGLNNPRSVALDSSGNIYVADDSDNRVRKVTVSAITPTITPSSSTNVPTNAPSKVPSIAPTFAPSYAPSSATTASSQDIISTVAGSNGDSGPATCAILNLPYGIAVDASGNYYIADTSNNRIRKVTASTGIVTTVAGTGSASYSGDNGQATTATLNKPIDVAIYASGRQSFTLLMLFPLLPSLFSQASYIAVSSKACYILPTIVITVSGR